MEAVRYMCSHIHIYIHVYMYFLSTARMTPAEFICIYKNTHTNTHIHTYIHYLVNIHPLYLHIPISASYPLSPPSHEHPSYPVAHANPHVAQTRPRTNQVPRPRVAWDELGVGMYVYVCNSLARKFRGAGCCVCICIRIHLHTYIRSGRGATRKRHMYVCMYIEYTQNE